MYGGKHSGYLPCYSGCVGEWRNCPMVRIGASNNDGSNAMEKITLDDVQCLWHEIQAGQIQMQTNPTVEGALNEQIALLSAYAKSDVSSDPAARVLAMEYATILLSRKTSRGPR